MGGRAAALVAVGGLALLLLLVACTGFRRTDVQEPVLIIGAAANMGGGVWEIKISVGDMPAGGAAAIAIKHNGLSFIDIDAASIQAEGLSGFVVVASDFVAPDPQGAVCAANAHTGVESGPILKLKFTATGGNPSIAIDKAEVEIASDAHTLIPLGDIETDVEYYTK